MTQLSLLEIKQQTPSRYVQIPAKEEKTKDHTSQPQTAPETVKSVSKEGTKSRSRWTDEEWRKEYWRITSESPKELIRRALEREDGRTALRLDHILTGYHGDSRKRNRRRTEDDLIADGNWYLLCELVKEMREGKK